MLLPVSYGCGFCNSYIYHAFKKYVVLAGRMGHLINKLLKTDIVPSF